MAIRKVARMGHPILRKRAVPIESNDILRMPVQNLISDLFDSMKEYGGIGLAAPQVHESLQIAVIEFTTDNDRYPNMGAQGPLVLINPTIEVLDPILQEFWEGCLSVPELRGKVARPRKIRVSYLSEKAQARTIEPEGFLATVFQHELDHLWGNLFVDKLVDSKSLTFMDEFRRFHLSKGAQSIDEEPIE